MGSRVQIPRNQFGLIWTRLNPWVGRALDTSLHLGSWNPELSFIGLFFLWGSNQLIFTPKWCNVSLALICHFLGLGPSSKGHHGSNLWLSSNRIALFHWTLDLEPSSKVALRNNDHVYYRVIVHKGGKAKVGGKLQNYLTRWITKPWKRKL
jgi:hypothetical protein